MGIAFSHWDIGIPHSMFHRLRRRLAREISIDLDRMEGYAAYRADGTVKSRGTRSWEDLPDPLVLVLRASDVEASFSPEECWAIKRRLQEIAPGLTSEKDHGARGMVLALAEAMARAAFLGERFSWSG